MRSCKIIIIILYVKQNTLNFSGYILLLILPVIKNNNHFIIAPSDKNIGHAFSKEMYTSNELFKTTFLMRRYIESYTRKKLNTSSAPHETKCGEL